MSTLEKLKEQISSNSVVLYMKGTSDLPQCGFSAQTVHALRACNVQFLAVDVLADPQLRSTLKSHSRWPTFPQLHAEGELIGGCDIVLEMFQSGELRQLLKHAGAESRRYLLSH
jgi:monothiol glutaredoxin